jgi:hypothetical protein
MATNYLLLKWGTLKGWCFENSPEAFEALQEYGKIGMSESRMMQKDTDRQKELVCIMIDKVKGKVQNDWDGKTYRSKKDAKKYVMDYGKKENA